MLLSANTMLITGGASGIGLALAERFLRAGNRLIVCGRRQARLEELKRRHPEVETRVCDVAEAAQREALAAWAVDRASSLNVLVNNAGIQRRVQLSMERDWPSVRSEIAINFEAQEATYGFSQQASRASRDELDAIFQRMNARS